MMAHMKAAFWFILVASSSKMTFARKGCARLRRLCGDTHSHKLPRFDRIELAFCYQLEVKHIYESHHSIPLNTNLVQEDLRQMMTSWCESHADLTEDSISENQKLPTQFCPV
jgi:hypothetical protein